MGVLDFLTPGLLAGAGDIAAQENRDRHQQQLQILQQEHDDLHTAAGDFEKIMNSDDWPAEARMAAAQARYSILSGTVKPKQVDKLWVGVRQASRRPVVGARERNASRSMLPSIQAMAGARSEPGTMPLPAGGAGGGTEATAKSPFGESNANDAGGAPPQSSPFGLDFIVPGMSDALRQQATQLQTFLGSPEQESVEGPYTRGEQSDMAMQQLLRQLQIQNQFRPDKYAAGPGGMLYEATTGKIVREPTFPVTAFPFASGPGDMIYRKDTGEVKREPTFPPPRPPSLASQTEPVVQIFDPETQQVTWVPRSQAIGRPAPRTTFDETGAPHTGGTAASLNAPPTVPTETQEKLRAYDLIDAQVTPIAQQIERIKSNLGPIWGRISKFEVAKLGGWGVDAKTQEAITRMRRLMSTQAFAEGGKQLTGIEKAEFEAILARPEDTPELIMQKLKLLTEFTGQKRDAIYRYLPPRVRAQVPPQRSSSGPTRPSPAAAAAPSVSTPTAPGTTSGIADSLRKVKEAIDARKAGATP